MIKESKDIEETLKKILILSEIYDEMMSAEYSEEDGKLAKIKMGYVKEQIAKLTFEIKKNVELMEEKVVLGM